jgi:hypothetical protein
MAVFERGAADGLAMGAATARGLTKRVLYWRNDYAVTMLSGAGMILFRRDAAELILRNYRTTTSTEITDWFLQLSGKDHREIGESGTGAGAADTRIASDMIYEVVLQKHGLAIGATVPALAKNLDAEHLVFRDVGGYCSTETAVRSSTDDASFARFVQRLADYRPEHARDRQPYLHFGSLHCWMIFLHQILFVPDAEAALRGRWKIVWEKFNGPFGYDALEPGASLSFPLHGELKGIFCSRTPDGGIVEVYQGDRLIGDFDSYADTPTRDQYFAGFNLAADGAGPITFRLSARRNPASSGSTFRISSLCFSTAQPWLPNVGSFTADAFVALLERQAKTGGLSF